MQLVRPGPEHLASYVAALERGWSADNERGIEAAREELSRIHADAVGDARTDHSGNWQANLQKAKDGHCHVNGVAVRSSDAWIKAINTDFEIK